MVEGELLTLSTVAWGLLVQGSRAPISISMGQCCGRVLGVLGGIIQGPFGLTKIVCWLITSPITH